tara:strand:+ start:63709 stop:64308 length:600 start_codon:yes stop_codon:yes gene_type:complete
LKKPSEILLLEKYKVKLYEENDYQISSLDNWYTYSNIFLSTNEFRPTSLIGLKVYDNDDKLISDCLIGAKAGATGINLDSTLISYGRILVCCSNAIFKLSLPGLNLEWYRIADPATCFGIYNLNEDYLVHGELELTRLDKDGKIVWKQSGRDIWTTPEAHDYFAIYEDYILATDWEYNRYKFDYDGQLLEEYKVFPKNE